MSLDHSALDAKGVLMRLGANTLEPTWSSHLIDGLWNTVLSHDTGTVATVALAGYHLFPRDQIISDQLFRFLLDLTYNGRLRHLKMFREQYARADFTEVTHLLENSSFPTFSFFCGLVMPLGTISPLAAFEIMRTTIGTPYWGNVVSVVETSLQTEEGVTLVVEWAATQASELAQHRVESLLTDKP